MRTLEYSTVIRESAQELRSMLHQSVPALIDRRLRFLLALKTTPSLSRAKAGLLVGLKHKGSEEVWNLYRKGGISLICDYPYKGKKSSLSAQDKEWLINELQADDTQTLTQAAEKIKEHTHSSKALTPQAVHYIFKALKIKKKTGRPAHIHKDQAKVEAFKKNDFQP